MEIKVNDVPAVNRFEITVDGELAGFAEYDRYEKEIAFLHTEIDPAFEGKGLGSQLVREALESVREQKLEVLPYCAFVRAWIARHPEYVELVRESRRPRFGF
jgi:predicted GNAT family acetyltransferase